MINNREFKSKIHSVGFGIPAFVNKSRIFTNGMIYNTSKVKVQMILYAYKFWTCPYISSVDFHEIQPNIYKQ